MATEIKIPIPDQTTEEVRVVKWHKAVGDAVNAGEVVLEVETDKSVIEVEAVGAGVLLGTTLRQHLGEDIERFIEQGKLIIGICNGFQALVNFGLLPGFEGRYRERRLALAANDSGNFVDTWVSLKINPNSACVFTKGISAIDLPIRHGEGKFYGVPDDMERLIQHSQVVAQYADPDGRPAEGKRPFNPNGSLNDIAGICDPTGRVFGIMPHPEAFNHFTNHPDWPRKREELRRAGKTVPPEEGEGIRIFRNAVEYMRGI